MEDFRDSTSFKDFPTAEELPPREPGRKQPSALKPILFVILIIGIMVLAYLALAKARDIWPFSNSGQKDDGGQICIQVITRAKNPKTGEVRDFTTPCDVPEGWEIIPPETIE